MLLSSSDMASANVRALVPIFIALGCALAVVALSSVDDDGMSMVGMSQIKIALVSPAEPSKARCTSFAAESVLQLARERTDKRIN